MSTDVAALILKVDSTDAKRASAELDKLTVSSKGAQQATAALGETEEQARQRIRAMVQATASATGANRTLGESERSLAERMGKRAVASEVARKATTDTIKAQTAQMVQTEEYIGLKAAETEVLAANTVARKVNSRTASEFGVLLGELASGNTGRVKRTIPALANSMGLLAKLATPAGLAVAGVAAATAALAIGAYKGSEQSERLATDILATGNAAGVTKGELEGMVDALGDANGRYGEARQAIEALAKSGAVPGLALQQAGQSAIDFAKVTGSSIEDAVKEIVKLRADPVKAVKELNDSYNFLTPAIYAQISALQEQGRTQDAAAVAEKAFADANAERAKEVVEHTGWMSKAATATGHAFSAMWDAIEGVGREETLAQKAKEIQDQLTNLSGLHALGAGNVVVPGLSATDPRIVKLKADLDGIRRQQIAEGFKAVADQDKAASTKQFAAASDALLTGAQKYATAGEKARKQIEEVNKNLAIALANDPANASKYQAEASTQIAGINAQLAKANRPRKATDYAYKWSMEDSAQHKKEMDAEQKEINQRNRAEGELKSYTATLQSKLATDRAELRLRVESIGMGDREIALRRQILQIQKEADRERAKLDEPANAAKLTKENLEARKAEIQKYENDRVQQAINADAQIAKAQSNALSGLKRAMENYATYAGNTADQVAGLFNDAAANMTDAIVQFAMTGKLSFRDFADAVVADLIRIQTEKALAGLVGAAATGLSFGEGASYLANGGVFSSPSLSAYSGGVYDSPHMFKFAHGAGIFGEAGPEAIMPLARGSDGKLGVKSQGGGQSINVVTEVNIDSSGNATSQTRSGSDSARQLGKMVGDKVREVMTSESRPGGMLWKMQHN